MLPLNYWSDINTTPALQQRNNVTLAELNLFYETEKYIFMFSIITHREGADNLTHWGRMTHISVSKLNIIGSDNGMSPDRRQTIIWTNGDLLLIRPFGTNFNEIYDNCSLFSKENLFEDIIREMAVLC